MSRRTRVKSLALLIAVLAATRRTGSPRPGRRPRSGRSWSTCPGTTTSRTTSSRTSSSSWRRSAPTPRSPDHRPGRPRSRLRQEPRRLAVDQALPPDPGHAGRRRQRRRGLGRAQPGRSRHPGRLRRLVEDQLPRRPLRPVLLGPRLGLAPRLDDGGRHRPAGDGLDPDEVKSVQSAGSASSTSSATTPATWPRSRSWTCGTATRRRCRVAGVREHGRHRVRHRPLPAPGRTRT